LQDIAIPSLFGKPNYPTILLEPLQREETLKNIEKSGWRDDPGQQKTHPRPSMDEDGSSVRV
jgi:hypothetical protein